MKFDRANIGEYVDFRDGYKNFSLNLAPLDSILEDIPEDILGKSRGVIFEMFEHGGTRHIGRDGGEIGQILSFPLLLKEAAASSQIEGFESGMIDVYSIYTEGTRLENDANFDAQSVMWNDITLRSVVNKCDPDKAFEDFLVIWVAYANS